MKKRILSFILASVLVLLFVSAADAATLSNVPYDWTSISHRYDTSTISKPSGNWTLAKDSPTRIKYTNNSDPSDVIITYHEVYFVNQSGSSVCGGYKKAYTSSPYSITGSNMTGNNASTATTLKARIKNRYYGQTPSYTMSTAGKFTAY